MINNLSIRVGPGWVILPVPCVCSSILVVVIVVYVVVAVVQVVQTSVIFLRWFSFPIFQELKPVALALLSSSF